MSAAVARWAKKQRVGGSGRKAVLMMLAHLADKNGALKASIAAIAEACEMSANNAVDHLDHLAAAGLIERAACYREDSGRDANRIVLRCKVRQGCATSPPRASEAPTEWGRA